MSCLTCYLMYDMFNILVALLSRFGELLYILLLWLEKFNLFSYVIVYFMFREFLA